MVKVPKKKELQIPEVNLKNIDKIFRGVLDELEEHPEKFEKILGEGEAGNPITLGSRVIDSDEWAKKQTERAAAASGEWLKRTLKPRKHPIQAAIKADAKRKDKLAKAEAEGKWLKKMKLVNEDEMFETIKKVGEQGFRSGIENRSHKINRTVKELQPMVAAAAATIDAMPDATDADREKRLLAARRLMIEIGKKRAGV